MSQGIYCNVFSSVKIFSMEGKRYFHVCTKGSDLDWMFRDDADFIGGVNRIGLCVLTTLVQVFSFILMDNHVHFILYGTLPECKNFITKYKQLTGRWVYEKYGIAKHLLNVSVSVVPIYSAEDLMEVAAYIDRNSIVAGFKYLPTEYPWGSARYMFKRYSDKLDTEYVPIGHLTEWKLRHLLNTRIQIPLDWEINSEGMINPRCFFKIDSLESIFKTPARYLYFTTKKLEGKIDVTISNGQSPFITDKEMRRIMDRIVKDLFGVTNKSLLDFKSRMIIAKKLRYEYAATHKQIARLLQLNIDSVKGFV